MLFNNQMRSILNLAAAGVAVSCACSCGSGTSEDNKDNAADTASAVKQEDQQKTKNIFYSMPSPVELGQIMKMAGATYDKKYLNSTENASKYSSAFSKSVNLGVYVADLSYSTIFSQTQETILYLNCAKKMADGLGIMGAFSSETIKRMESNSNSQDSLIDIISSSYLNSNEYLKENQRSNTATLAIMGGWIEGLYIGTQVAKATKNNAAIITRIAELKGSLNNLIAMLDDQSGDENISSVLNELKEIKKIYDETPAGQSKPEVSVNEKTNVITIGGASKHTLNNDQFEKVTQKIETLRASITKI